MYATIHADDLSHCVAEIIASQQMDHLGLLYKCNSRFRQCLLYIKNSQFVTQRLGANIAALMVLSDRVLDGKSNLQFFKKIHLLMKRASM
jgi:hypothetical protein